MSAVLHRDPIPPDASHVECLPAWIAPARKPDAYWHQPRSAFQHSDGRVTVTFWCGQIRHVSGLAAIIEADPPIAQRCGTCLGRRLGYDRADAIFRPRDHWTLPAVCPGDDDGTGRCLACATPVRYYGFWTRVSCRHAPTPALAERCEPCPAHGWRDLRPLGGRLVCGSWRCGFDAGPFV